MFREQNMATFHELQIQQRDLLNDLDALDENTETLSAAIQTLAAADVDHDEIAEQRERLAWLHRQRAGLLVVLSETERSLLAFESSEDHLISR
jgi:hypothetical protein